jgi:hypothetical protein
MKEHDFILSLVPQSNLQAYAYLFIIEVGLRELIIERMDTLDGRNWYKTRLPSDVLKKYREGRAKESGIPWTHFVHHDPLYYIDFPELSKVMDRGNNWRDAFQDLFGQKNVLLAMLRSLEEIRNKVAHNRKVTARDLDQLKHAFSQIVTCLGSERLALLVATCSNADGAVETLQRLREDARRCVIACLNCEALPEQDAWREARQSPWIGMLSTQVDFVEVERFFHIMDAYEALPRSTPGFRLVRWTKLQNIDEAYSRAEYVLQQMLAEVTSG